MEALRLLRIRLIVAFVSLVDSRNVSALLRAHDGRLVSYYVDREWVHAHKPWHRKALHLAWRFYHRYDGCTYSKLYRCLGRQQSKAFTERW